MSCGAAIGSERVGLATGFARGSVVWRLCNAGVGVGAAAVTSAGGITLVSLFFTVLDFAAGAVPYLPIHPAPVFYGARWNE